MHGDDASMHGLRETIMPPIDAIITKVVGEHLAVPMGWISGVSGDTKFGINPNVDTAAAEDMWAGGGDYTGFPSGAAETVDVSSDNIADTAAGTGARTIRLFGLDANFLFQTEDITLNGLTLVTSIKTWSRLPRGRVLTAGSLENNAGTITAHHTTTTANVFFVILPGDGGTLVACTTVPANETMIIDSLFAGLSANTVASQAGISLRAREPGGVFIKMREHGASLGSPIDRTYKRGLTLPEKTDVKIRVESVSANNTSLFGEFDYVLHAAY